MPSFVNYFFSAPLHRISAVNEALLDLSETKEPSQFSKTKETSSTLNEPSHPLQKPSDLPQTCHTNIFSDSKQWRHSLGHTIYDKLVTMSSFQ